MDPLLPTDLLAMTFNVSEGSIRRWASLDRLPRVDGPGRRKLYRLSAVQAAYDRRHPEQP